MSAIIKNMNEELWKTIAGYPDYEVSSKGRVKSYRQKKPKILSPKKFGKGYRGVVLCGARRSMKYLHHLVLEMGH